VRASCLSLTWVTSPGLTSGALGPSIVCVCVHYCSTYYKAVRVGGLWGDSGGHWWCATRDDEPRPVWTSLPITQQWTLVCRGCSVGGDCRLSRGCSFGGPQVGRIESEDTWSQISHISVKSPSNSGIAPDTSFQPRGWNTGLTNNDF
jgi:hypothetical protein